MTKKNKATKIKIPSIIAIIIVLVAAAVVLVLVFNCGKKEGEPKAESLDIIDEVYGLYGEIKEIQDKALIVEALILLKDGEKEPIKQEVKILINEETNILKLKFPEEIPEDSTKPIYPKETKISFDDLEVGDKIDIKMAENVAENIKNKTEFAVSIINVIE